jgi:NhaP-type Na+/H+ or K+/H+ antiporter
VVTGPTVINPLLKEVGVDRRVATILEGEGVLIDALGAILAVVVLDVVPKGAAGGWLLSWFLKRSQFLAADPKSSVEISSLSPKICFIQSALD